MEPVFFPKDSNIQFFKPVGRIQGIFASEGIDQNRLPIGQARDDKGPVGKALGSGDGNDCVTAMKGLDLNHVFFIPANHENETKMRGCEVMKLRFPFSYLLIFLPSLFWLSSQLHFLTNARRRSFFISRISGLLPVQISSWAAP